MTERQHRGRTRVLGVGILLLIATVAAVLIPRWGGAAAGGADTNPVPTTTPTPTAVAGPIRLLGFGDSVMAGAGCDCDDFLTQVAAQLHRKTGRQVTATNDGANGETAAGLLRDLRTDDAYRAEITRADVIVVTIGANDLGPALDAWNDEGCGSGCYQPRIVELGTTLSAILTIIDRWKPAGTPVLVTTYWNVFEDGDVGAADNGSGYLAWSDQVTRAANSAICRSARGAAATCVDLYEPFKADGSKDPTRLLATDGDHPNEAGTTLIADVVAAAAERRLAD